MNDRMAERMAKLELRRDDRDYLSALGSLESKSLLVSPSAIIGRVKAAMREPQRGLWLPWHSESASISRFMPGRWSLWSGPTGSGKTQLLRTLMLHALSRRLGVLFISLEEEPEVVLKEFMCAAACRRDLNDTFMDWCVADWEHRLYIFEHSGYVLPNVALGAAAYAADELGVKHVVIDSRMRLKIRKDDLDAEGEIAATIARIVKQKKIHLHLVVHPRKTLNSQEMMDLYDVQGAQELVANADNVITLQRAPKVEKIRKANEIPDWCDAIYRQWKQRGDWDVTGVQHLVYHHGARQWGMALPQDHEIPGKRPPVTPPVRFAPRDVYIEAGYETQGHDMFGKTGEAASTGGGYQEEDDDAF